MPKPAIAIIILTWNGKDDTLDCLASLVKVDYSNHSLIVVDNGSADDTVEVVRKAYPDVTLIENCRNLGFAEGNNVGIKYALERGADYILLLNNDTVVAPDILDAFLMAADAYPNAGVYGGKIYYDGEPDRIWYAGGVWDKKLRDFIHIGQGEIDDAGKYDGIAETEYICGCAMFVKRQVFEQVGGFDSDFFLTYEESDWCFRARRAGYSCLVVPQARVWHKISRSFGSEASPLLAYFLTRNRLYWAKKHLSPIGQAQVFSRILREMFPRFSYGDAQAYGFVRRFYWALQRFVRDCINLQSKSRYQAQIVGIRDFLSGRLGDCPSSVRQLKSIGT